MLKKSIWIMAFVLLAFVLQFTGFAAPPVEAMEIGAEGIGLGLMVNRATLNSVFVNLKTTFHRAFGAAESQWQEVAMRVPSTSKRNDYHWLSSFPKMRKWVGEKVAKSLEAFKYSIVNDDWEATIEVDRNDIEDDELGIYEPQAQMAGYSAKQLPDEIVSDLLNYAFAALCYDGQYFYDTDHPVGDGDGGTISVSNKGTAQLSIATQAAAAASYGAARIAMMSLKDDEGRPLNVTPGVLEVGPALMDTANALMTNDRLEDGKVNAYKGTAKVKVNPRITSTTAWFLHDTSKPIKPFIYQERKAPVFVQQTDPQSENVFNQKKFKFGAEARAAGGYGLWQLSYASDGSV